MFTCLYFFFLGQSIWVYVYVLASYFRCSWCTLENFLRLYNNCTASKVCVNSAAFQKIREVFGWLILCCRVWTSRECCYTGRKRKRAIQTMINNNIGYFCNSLENEKEKEWWQHLFFSFEMKVLASAIFAIRICRRLFIYRSANKIRVATDDGQMSRKEMI